MSVNPTGQSGRGIIIRDSQTTLRTTDPDFNARVSDIVRAALNRMPPEQTGLIDEAVVERVAIAVIGILNPAIDQRIERATTAALGRIPSQAPRTLEQLIDERVAIILEEKNRQIQEANRQKEEDRKAIKEAKETTIDALDAAKPHLKTCLENSIPKIAVVSGFGLVVGLKCATTCVPTIAPATGPLIAVIPLACGCVANSGKELAGPVAEVSIAVAKLGVQLDPRKWFEKRS